MNVTKTAELISHIKKNIHMLDLLFGSIIASLENDVKLLGRTNNAALIVSGLIENYYTCLETIFVRVSQFFENSLGPERWHAGLLDRMTLEIEGVRIVAVSLDNHGRLLELLKFRHFRRYYFELECDWDRLDFLLKKLNEAHPKVKIDLEKFVEFLKQI